MAIDEADEISIGVTAFKARCLALIDEVAQGKTRRVLLIKHNRAVAAIVPVDREPAELWGAMRGTVKVAPGADPTQGTGEVWPVESRAEIRGWRHGVAVDRLAKQPCLAAEGCIEAWRVDAHSLGQSSHSINN